MLQPSEAEKVQPAGFWIRFLAYFIDMLILLVPSMAAMFIQSVAGYLVVAMCLILYKPATESFLGGTAGKMLLGLRVLDMEGRSVHPSAAVVRNAFFILPMLPNMILQIRMIRGGVSPMDLEAVQAFQETNEMLYLVISALSVLVLISCLLIVFNDEKLALHDRMAGTQVVRNRKK